MFIDKKSDEKLSQSSISLLAEVPDNVLRFIKRHEDVWGQNMYKREKNL